MCSLYKLKNLSTWHQRNQDVKLGGTSTLGFGPDHQHCLEGWWREVHSPQFSRIKWAWENIEIYWTKSGSYREVPAVQHRQCSLYIVGKRCWEDRCNSVGCCIILHHSLNPGTCRRWLLRRHRCKVARHSGSSLWDSSPNPGEPPALKCHREMFPCPAQHRIEHH